MRFGNVEAASGWLCDIWEAHFLLWFSSFFDIKGGQLILWSISMTLCYFKKKKKKRTREGLFSPFPLDGTVPPIAVARPGPVWWVFICSVVSLWEPCEGKGGTALPGPGRDGAIGLCRLNQDRTGTGPELVFQKATWF